MTHSEARKRASEAASNSESAALATNSPERGNDTSETENGPQNGVQPIPAPVDSGAIGRLNETQTRDLLLRLLVAEYGDEGWSELGSLRRIARSVNDHFDTLVREHTNRALAEVEQRIEAEMWTGGAGPLSIVRAARQEQGRG